VATSCFQEQSLETLTQQATLTQSLLVLSQHL
jgi:hypothetical protein